MRDFIITWLLIIGGLLFLGLLFLITGTVIWIIGDTDAALPIKIGAGVFLGLVFTGLLAAALEMD